LSLPWNFECNFPMRISFGLSRHTVAAMGACWESLDNDPSDPFESARWETLIGDRSNSVVDSGLGLRADPDGGWTLSGFLTV
jgi:hypothetical protein